MVFQRVLVETDNTGKVVRIIWNTLAQYKGYNCLEWVQGAIEDDNGLSRFHCFKQPDMRVYRRSICHL